MTDIKKPKDITSLFKYDNETKSNYFYEKDENGIYHKGMRGKSKGLITPLTNISYERMSCERINEKYSFHGNLIIKETEQNEHSDRRLMTVSLWHPVYNLHSSPEFGFTVMWGQSKNTPCVIVVENWGDYGFDHSQILFGMKNDYKIDSLKITHSTTREEINRFKSEVIEYYKKKYNLSK